MKDKVKALGMGLSALIPEKSDNLGVINHNLGTRNKNLEVITQKVVDESNVICDNSEVISSNLDARNKNLEVITQKIENESNVTRDNLEVLILNLEGQNDIVDVKKSKVDVLSYNLEVLKQASSEAGKNPRISLWLPKSAAVLRYLRKTQPEFSISEEASILLDEAIRRKYPKLLAEIEKLRGGKE